jgi:hypothetical protein
MATAPTPPQITVRPVATSGALQFFWAAPASDGGSAITGYTLSCSGLTPQSLGASTYEYTYTGLTNGTSYTFSITAENAVGSSTAATFRTVQPGNKPGPVQNLTVTRTDATTATLNWTAPASDGGASLLGYAVRAVSTDPYDATIKQSVVQGTSARITGLNGNSVYRYSVTAVNDPGHSTEVNSGLYSLTTTSYEASIGGELNYWGGIACDMSGTKLLATTGQVGSSQQPLYVSKDGGVTWKEETTSVAIYRQWRKCASSADGTKLVAVVGAASGLPYRSTDSGQTWTELSNVSPTIALTWNGIASSADGSVLLGSGSGSSIRYSVNSGSTWAAATAGGVLTWSGYCCSANGQMMAACSATFIWRSTDTGANWAEQTAAGSRGWQAIACSSDGTKIVACASDGRIYRTADTGANWSLVYTLAANPASNVFTGIACSADGTRIYATTRYAIYVSTDSGTTWERKAISWNGSTSYVFNHMACSNDGMTVYATKGNGNIWKSDNGGATWRELSSPRNNLGFASCMSSNGQIQYIGDSGGAIGSLWKSTDYGVTWARVPFNGQRQWRAICCSADGTRVAATEAGGRGYIWTSADAGDTWTEQTSAGFNEWRGISCDISGTKLVACDSNTTKCLYTGDLSGSDFVWTQLSGTGAGTYTWRSVACSADRTKIASGFSTSGNYVISLNSGASWTTSSTLGSLSQAKSWACTPDFSVIIVAGAANNGGIFKSTNMGVSFTRLSGSGGLPAPSVTDYYSVAISSDGTKIAAYDFNEGNIYISSDSGDTWAAPAVLTNKKGYTLSMSSDGSILMAYPYGGGGPIIYRLFG